MQEVLVNQLITRDCLSMMWHAMVARVGPLQSIFDELKPASGTRAAADGRLNSPVTTNVAVVSGVKLWNEYHEQLMKIKTKKGLKSFVEKEVWKCIPV